MGLDSAIDQVNQLHPQWWLFMPWNARQISIPARVDITDLTNDQEVKLCKGKTGVAEVASIFYEMQSYTAYPENDPPVTLLDNPGVITGRLFWLPEVAGRGAGSFLTQYPNSNGYIGAPVGAIGAKHSGFNVTTDPAAPAPPPLLLSPGQSYDLLVRILSTDGGDPIPDRARRYLQGRIWGWAVPVQP